jgi:hypothetical protein
MMKEIEVSPALQYFFRKLENKSAALEDQKSFEALKGEEVPFEELEKFFRALKTQNIFIFTVGMSGKPASTLLEKAVFNLNKVVRVYYSTSFDESVQGFVRIRIDMEQRLILVERMHGYRPQPELLYASKDECHVIRFMVRWLMRRIDWEKTKIDNLELYKRFKEHRQDLIEALLAEEKARLEEEDIQNQLEKHFGSKAKAKIKKQ